MRLPAGFIFFVEEYFNPHRRVCRLDILESRENNRILLSFLSNEQCQLIT